MYSQPTTLELARQFRLSPSFPRPERLFGDALNPSHCRDRGSEVVHAQGLKWDYFVYCLNSACPHWVGEDVGDTECPDWCIHPQVDREAVARFLSEGPPKQTLFTKSFLISLRYGRSLLTFAHDRFDAGVTSLNSSQL